MNILALFVPSVLLLAGGTWAKQGLLAACSSEAAVELFGSPQGCLEFYSEVVQKGQKMGGIHLTEFLIKAKSLGDSYSLDVDKNLLELPEFLHRFKRTAEPADEKNSTVSEEAVKHENVTQQPSNQTVDHSAVRNKRQTNVTANIPDKNSSKLNDTAPILEGKNTTTVNLTAEHSNRRKREGNATVDAPPKNNSTKLNDTAPILEGKNTTTANLTAEHLNRNKREGNETVDAPPKNNSTKLNDTAPILEGKNTTTVNLTAEHSNRNKREGNATVDAPPKNNSTNETKATNLWQTLETASRNKRQDNHTADLPVKNDTKSFEADHSSTIQAENQTRNTTQSIVKPDGLDSVDNSKTSKQDKIKEMIQEKLNNTGRVNNGN